MTVRRDADHFIGKVYAHTEGWLNGIQEITERASDFKDPLTGQYQMLENRFDSPMIGATRLETGLNREGNRIPVGSAETGMLTSVNGHRIEPRLRKTSFL
jgi:hypothetical protein